MKSFRHVTTSHYQTKRLKSRKINGLVHELYLDLVTQSICPACKAWHHRPGAWNKPMPTSSVKWRVDVFDFICTPDQLRIGTPSLLFLFPCLELVSVTKSQKATGMHQHNIPTYTNSSSPLYLIHPNPILLTRVTKLQLKTETALNHDSAILGVFLLTATEHPVLQAPARSRPATSTEAPQRIVFQHFTN